MFIGKDYGIEMSTMDKLRLYESAKKMKDDLKYNIAEKMKIIKWLESKIEDLGYEIQQAEVNLSKIESQIDSAKNELGWE